MKDFLNNALKEGDTVAYLPPNYRELKRGVVVGFTPKGVVIKRDPDERTIQFYAQRNQPIQHTFDRRPFALVARIENYE